MSKPPQRIIQSLLRFHFNGQITNHIASTPKPSFHNAHRFSTFSSNGFSNSALNPLKPQLFSKPISSNGVLCPKFGSFRSFFEGSCRNLKLNDGSSKKLGLGFDPLRIRSFSARVSNVGKKVGGNNMNGNLAKKVVEKPLSVVNSTFSRYKDVIGLQIEGFWKRNYLLLVGAAGVIVCYTLWKIMYGIANTFIGLSEGLARYEFLALSAAMVALFGLYLRSRYTINPDKVYRMAMTELNTSAKILEVMGSPLIGTDLRAYVMSGGGLSMTKFKPRLRSKRCFLIFPIRGSERKGLVSVGVKKSKGKYNMKLLAVDVPQAPGQPFFVIGDEEEYKVGGGLIAELRDPVIRAMAASKEFEEMDDIEAEEEEQQELQDAERKHQEEIAKLERNRTQ